MVHRPKILCVDDEPVNNRLLQMVLAPDGYDVSTAENGRIALEKLSQERFDLVILDVMMPGMNGFDVCRTIRGNEDYRNIPVVMVTALTSKQDRIKGIETGAEDFISKPIDEGEVLARVRMLLKVRAVNDLANSAYSTIINLTSIGERFIRTFSPLTFDFMQSIDTIVSQTLRQRSDEIEKPESVIIRILGEQRKYAWYQYEFIRGRLERTHIDLGLVAFDFTLGNESKSLFYNEDAVEDRIFKSFTRKLNDFIIAVRNLVCYLSEAFCIFAINYGRAVSQYDAAVINNLVMQGLFLKSLSTQIREVESVFEYTVHALARAAEANDEDTRQPHRQGWPLLRSHSQKNGHA